MVVGLEGPPADLAVAGAPFTLEGVTTSTQVLADGNRIERTFTGSLARDSRGRLRQEQDVVLPGAMASVDAAPRMVSIIDPDAKVQYLLDDVNKIARKMPLPMGPPKGPRPPTADDGRPMPPPPGDRQGPPPPDAMGPPPGRGEGLPPGGPGGPRPEVKTESLGEREIAGVVAVGTRITMTIAAGTMGNDRAIDVVTERWIAKELGVPVLITRQDPRMGETVHKVTHLTRDEPPASLFEVPADYTIVAGGPMERPRSPRR